MSHFTCLGKMKNIPAVLQENGMHMLGPWAIIGFSAAPHKRQTRESWQTKTHPAPRR